MQYITIWYIIDSIQNGRSTFLTDDNNPRKFTFIFPNSSCKYRLHEQNTKFFPFWVCLILLNMMIFSPIFFLQNVWFYPYFWLNKVPLCMHTFFCPFVCPLSRRLIPYCEYCGYPPINMDEQGLWRYSDIDSLKQVHEYMLRRGIAESYGCSIQLVLVEKVVVSKA